MASYLDKTQVNTALIDNTKLDLGHQSVMTSDFFQTNVATILELVPGSKLDVKMESFARLNPLPVPTFGRASMRNRAFFVPFRTIFRGWNDFITDVVHVASDGYNGAAGLLSTVPTVDMADLAGAFKNSIGLSPDSNALLYGNTAPGVYDITWSGAGSFYNYTTFGRRAIALLEQLGYKVDFDAKQGDCVLSAMPLLALAKVYIDWYWPQQYSNISSYDNLLAMCNFDVSNGPLQLNSTQVALILSVCSYTQYDSDLFVSAWDQPNQPNAGNYSDFKLVNIDTVGSFIGGQYSSPANYTLSQMNGVSNRSVAPSNADAIDRFGNMDAPFITPNLDVLASNNARTTISAPISEFLLHSLHALTDYMKRHQLAGSRKPYVRLIIEI